MLNLGDDVLRIRGIGEKKRERLHAIGIYTVSDLLNHLPVRYRDRRIVTDSERLAQPRIHPPDKEQLACGTLLRKSSRTIRGGRTLQNAVFRDDSGTFRAVFFNQPYLDRTLEIGKRYAVFGHCGRQGEGTGVPVFNTPDICPEGDAYDLRRVLPVYRCTEGITSRDFIKWVRYALQNVNYGEDWIPEDIRKARKLVSVSFLYENLHFPENDQYYKYARSRYIYEQLYLFMLMIRRSKHYRLHVTADASVPDVDIRPFLDALPFSLTEGQQSAADEIHRDLLKPEPMNRLVQGDVGCGKTVVAECAIYQVVKSGRQAAFMAPTEILARQHYQKLRSDLEPFGIHCAMLVHAMSSPEKKQVLERIHTGDAEVIVGTHALFQKDVQFADLSLIITDEQHRFGVNQRKALAGKSRAANVMVMSATPIPRTLRATVYGDMDFSLIRSMPESRKRIITRAVDSAGREKAYREVRREVAKGHQAYIVTPSIGNDEDTGLASVEKVYEEARMRFRKFHVAKLHGQMSAEDKDAVMREFASGHIQILISTVIVEVGIDVPNATIMLIENCERFGLAQLHQLRGRVGRGKWQSYCWLIRYSSSDLAMERTRIMTSTDDGFIISEEDYRLRGPGDITGTAQHGRGTLEIKNLLKYTAIMDAAKEDADRTDASLLDDTILRKMDEWTKQDNRSVL